MQDIVRGINKILTHSTKYASDSGSSEQGLRENAKTHVMPNEVAASFGTVSLERLLQNSQTYLKLGNYEAAAEVCVTVTREFPEDYRGWWGLIVCATHNFSKIMLDQSELNTWFGYAKQLSEPKDFDELEKIYVEYTRENSVLDVDDDIRAVDERIKNYNSIINNIAKQVSSTQNEKMNRLQSYHSQVNKINKFIAEQRQIISKSETDLLYAKVGMKFGIMFLILGACLMIAGGIANWHAFLFTMGLILGFIGFVLLISINSTHKICQNIEDAQNQIADAEEHKALFSEQCDADIETYNSIIKSHENEILTIRHKIADCKEYNKLGKDKIATFWFAERCSKFGVEQSVDQKVLELRKAIFE